jgi:hypothetical protein
LSPIRARYTSIAADPTLLAEVLQRGARNARERSETILSRVYRAVGLIPGEGDHRRRVGGRRSSSEWQSDIVLPPTRGHLHKRRIIMETKETQDVAATAAAEADAEAECITDCCVCCCCDTEEECSMEE